MDPHLRDPAVCGEHPEIRPAAQIPGRTDEAQPEEHSQAAEDTGLALRECRYSQCGMHRCCARACTCMLMLLHCCSLAEG